MGVLESFRNVTECVVIIYFQYFITKANNLVIAKTVSIQMVPRAEHCPLKHKTPHLSQFRFLKYNMEKLIKYN